MVPQAWELLDQLRGASSRGVWISAAAFRAHNSHQSRPRCEAATPRARLGILERSRRGYRG
jgi:hypothetical protein